MSVPRTPSFGKTPDSGRPPGRNGSHSLGRMIGRSPQIRRVFEKIEKVAATDVSVLIAGESGTGKELAAREIHELSPRKSHPFVPMNCGAIPEKLIESELFGHEEGALTDAERSREGRVEAAQLGTLFLDEIAELPTVLQVKLLRFLQENQIERVGGRSRISVDTRVIAATNVDLAQAIAEKRFREDLYYCLGVVVIVLPPLSERTGDVEFLAEKFLERQAAVSGRELVFTPAAIKAMKAYRWPGNIRELENRVQRAGIMAENGRITPQDLEISDDHAYSGRGLGEARQAVERRMIRSALARNKGNITRAASDLKISRPTLYELIDKLGIVR